MFLIIYLISFVTCETLAHSHAAQSPLTRMYKASYLTSNSFNKNHCYIKILDDIDLHDLKHGLGVFSEENRDILTPSAKVYEVLQNYRPVSNDFQALRAKKLERRLNDSYKQLKRGFRQFKTYKTPF